MATTSSSKGATPAPATQRPGGRTARVQRQVFEAALDLLATEGRAAVSMDAIASRAGVHKTTLYRRWGAVEPLIREACIDYDDRNVAPPDTGSLPTDLRALAESFGAYLSQPVTQAIVRMIVAEAPHDPELREWADGFWLTRSGPFDAVVDRAIERGELPEHATALDIAEPLMGPIILRALVTGFALDDLEFLHNLADGVAAVLDR